MRERGVNVKVATAFQLHGKSWIHWLRAGIGDALL
jgi:hypothetical protein